MIEEHTIRGKLTDQIAGKLKHVESCRGSVNFAERQWMVSGLIGNLANRRVLRKSRPAETLCSVLYCNMNLLRINRVVGQELSKIGLIGISARSVCSRSSWVWD